jgi:hypothetical protein
MQFRIIVTFFMFYVVFILKDNIFIPNFLHDFFISLLFRYVFKMKQFLAKVKLFFIHIVLFVFKIYL